MHHLLPKPGMMARRIGFNPQKLVILGEAIGSASVAGFRPTATTLSTKDIIRAALPKSDRLVLGFGQVDLELGYYYRRVIKRDSSVTPKSYVPWLVDIYLGFIDSLKINPEKLMIKGCHLTMFSNKHFTKRYVGKIIKGDTEITKSQSAEIQNILMQEILGESQTNEMLLNFNNEIRLQAKSRGFRYFDINNEIGYMDKEGNQRLKTAFMPAISDHHLADSIFIRRSFLSAVLKGFDINPVNYLRPIDADEKRSGRKKRRARTSAPLPQNP